MAALVYYSGRTNNTHRFISKLNLSIPVHRIVTGSERFDQPYVLFTPTYADRFGRNAVPEPVQEFLCHSGHIRLMKAVVASGNRNFGQNFGLAAHVLQEQFGVPIWHKFELFGLPSDIAVVEQRMSQCHTLLH